MSRPQAQPPGILGSATTACAAALLLWALVIHATPVPSADVNGTYKVQAAGIGHGTGSATVADKSVGIDCTLTTDNGDQLALKASNLKRTGNRFSGTGTLDGVRTSISGRIDPPSATHPVARFFATFLANDDRAGRLVGAPAAN